MKFTKKSKAILAIVMAIFALVAESNALKSALSRNEKTGVKANVLNENSNKSEIKNQIKNQEKTEFPVQAVSAGCIGIYTECNFKGEFMEICDNVSNFNQTWKKPIKSWVSSNKKNSSSTFVYFFEANYKGESWSTDTVVPCFSDTRAIQSAYVVKSGCAVLYRECNYKDPSGAVLTCSSLPTLGSTFPDKALKSIIASQEATIELFESPNYGGKKQTFTAFSACLDKVDFGKNTSSIKITNPAGPVVDPAIPAFEDGSYFYRNKNNFRTFTLQQMLLPNFKIRIKMTKVTPDAFVVGLSNMRIDYNYVYVGHGTAETSISWGVGASGSLGENGKVRPQKGTGYRSGDIVTLQGTNGVITYGVNGKMENYKFDMKIAKLYLTFSFSNNDDSVEILLN